MDIIELNSSELTTVSGGSYNRGNLLNGLQGLFGSLRVSPKINLNLNLSVIVIANSKIGGNLNIYLGQGIYL
jgi:hypothetical protein